MTDEELEELAKYLSDILEEGETLGEWVFDDMSLKGNEIMWIRDQIYWALADREDEDV